MMDESNRQHRNIIEWLSVFGAVVMALGALWYFTAYQQVEPPVASNIPICTS